MGDRSLRILVAGELKTDQVTRWRRSQELGLTKRPFRTQGWVQSTEELDNSQAENISI